jgi:hypothetical protein
MGLRGQVLGLDAGQDRPRQPGPVSFLAGAVLGSLADFLADGPAPSWAVRVGTCLELHLPARNLLLCLDRPGLLLSEPRRRLFAIFPGPAAKETRGAAKETHSVIVDRRLADFSPSKG